MPVVDTRPPNRQYPAPVEFYYASYALRLITIKAFKGSLDLMILFPRPRIFYLIALALAIPTYGVSLLVFYFLLKRPYDSRAASLILSTAKRCLETGLDGELFRVNRAGIERVFSKFSLPEVESKYGPGVPFIRWGVIVHPMINGAQPFTLRVTRNGGKVRIEASDGEVWWLLQED